MNNNKISFSLAILYDIDTKSDTYTLLYFDQIRKINGIPKELLTAFQSGLINTGCVCGICGGEKNEQQFNIAGSEKK
ncbi:MAG: hypothetical protein ACLRYM_06105 [Thomasclavelia ramosa]